MGRRIIVKRHIPAEELRRLATRERDGRTRERLTFIMALYEGVDVWEAAGRLGRCKATGYGWLRRWNAGGAEGLRPAFGGGHPHKLTEAQRAEFRDTLAGRDDWTTREVRSLIRDRYGVELHLRSVYRILGGLGLRCCKPYPSDYRRPGDAEERLRIGVEEALERLDDLEAVGGLTLGFLDECSPQTDSNTVRLWSLGRPRSRRSTTPIRANTFGCYAPAGESVVCFMGDSRRESVCAFLEEVRARNPVGGILLVLDNFPSHRATEVRRRAEELGMRLVYLPPYSPDLNPIEQIWRCVKRAVSTAYFRSKEEFLSVIEEAYRTLSSKTSFAAGWIQRFIPGEYKQLCL